MSESGRDSTQYMAKLPSSERWGGLSVESMLDGATLMHGHLVVLKARRDKGIKEPVLVESIVSGGLTHGFLMSRLSREEQKLVDSLFSDVQKKQYLIMVENVKKNLADIDGVTSEVGAGENFWQVHTTPRINSYAQTVESGNGHKASVQFKEYATFVPSSTDPQVMLKEIAHFYKSLIYLFQQISVLAKHLNEGVSMKFVAGIHEMMDTIDSVVIYVPNKKVGEAVQGVLKKLTADQELVLGARRGRPASGFDFKIGADQISHRQIIAKIIAKKIIADFNGAQEIEKGTPADLAKKVLGWTTEAGRLTPEEALEQIAI